MFCRNCGAQIDDKAVICVHCGVPVTPEVNNASGPRCPKCGGHNVDVQLHQENTGGKTITKTTSKYKQKGHGCLWWLCIGWWWWIIDLMLWLFIFPIRLLAQIFKKKKYVGTSTSVSSTNNDIKYKTVCLCKSCGHHWEQ